MTNQLKCGQCKATDVRLYRPYGNLYRVEDNTCNACIKEDGLGWMVPLCTDGDGSVWGYTSIPKDSHNAFLSLPEKDPTGWTWDRFVVLREEPNHWFSHEGWRKGNRFFSDDIFCKGEIYELATFAQIDSGNDIS